MKKQDSTLCCVQETHFRQKDIDRSKEEKVGKVAQLAKCLPGKHKALGSIPSTP